MKTIELETNSVNGFKNFLEEALKIKDLDIGEKAEVKVTIGGANIVTFRVKKIFEISADGRPRLTPESEE